MEVEMKVKYGDEILPPPWCMLNIKTRRYKIGGHLSIVALSPIESQKCVHGENIDRERPREEYMIFIKFSTAFYRTPGSPGAGEGQTGNSARNGLFSSG